jgi:hydroxymethylpyrimidine pyrophosphatase-like HAD family hydrolase
MSTHPPSRPATPNPTDNPPELMPISRLRPPSRPALIATDVDGTLTRAGKLDPAALAAITRLVAAGVAVVPVSGRPAGEVTGLCRYLPGVTRGLAENGLLEVIPDRAPRWLGRPTDKPRLREVGERLNREHGAGLRLTGDDFCRLGDVAYEREGRDEAELVRLRDLAAEMGVHLVWSNVHVHLAEAVPDKGAAVLQLASELGVDPRAIVTIGDAPNDAGLFVGGRFGATVGTADIAGQLAYLPAAPQYITAAREGAGFVEMAEAVLAVVSGGL